MNKIAIVSIVSFLAVSLVGAGAFFYLSDAESYESEGLFSEEPAIENNSSSQNLSDCIITIEGVQYNVAEFRKKHPGGDIFKCGEDMTRAFKSQHGAKQLAEIQKYRVTSEESPAN